jgi:flagellar assembly protein FliH
MSSERPSRSNWESPSEPFFYAPSSEAADSGNDGGDSGMPWNAPGSAPRINVEQKEKEAFERGAQEGEARARAAYEKQLAGMRASAVKSLDEFKMQREAYFTRVEPEIVQLALAIARKILHREAQMDPLLLTGMVHVALEKLDMGTRVRLRANPADIHFWKEYFAQGTSTIRMPELLGDESLLRGECAIEAEVGSTQVSLESQLKEIEQGFFDLLDQRPRVR